MTKSNTTDITRNFLKGMIDFDTRLQVTHSARGFEEEECHVSQS